MIKWCAYCQSYVGEVPPYDNFALTHGICAACAASNAFLNQPAPAGLDPLVAFFRKLRNEGRTGDLSAPAEWIKSGAALGIKPADMLIGLLQPALYEIGSNWARGEVTVAQEHRFSAFADAVTGLIYAHYPELNAGRNHASPDILLTNADGNYHTLGVKFLEVLLLSRGLRTFSVLPGLPAREVAALAASLRPRAIGVSVSMAPQMEELGPLAAALAGLPGGLKPRVIVGGQPIKDGALPPPGLGMEACHDIMALRL